MNEKLIERKATQAVAKTGGLALKFHSNHFTGMPDRLVLLQGGGICFAEFKTTGEQLKPRQVVVIRALTSLGFKVFVIDDQDSLTDFLNYIIL